MTKNSSDPKTSGGYCPLIGFQVTSAPAPKASALPKVNKDFFYKEKSYVVCFVVVILLCFGRTGKWPAEQTGYSRNEENKNKRNRWSDRRHKMPQPKYNMIPA
jgi:hypothetical protein